MKITNLDIELTQRCNLRCPYCYLGQHKASGTISDELLLKCLDLIAQFGNPRKTDKQAATRVYFYGGEPLLVFDKIKFFVEHAKKRQYDLTYLAVSNGTIDRPEIIEYCRRNKIEVQRSLDGCPEAMALSRGKEALEKYNRATPNWKDYHKTRRSTIMPATAKYLVENLRYFESLGFSRGYSPMPDFYADWTPETIQDYKNGLWKLADEFVKHYRKGKIIYLYWFERELPRFTFRRGTKPSQGCAAGKGLHCVAWNGYVYMCHRFTNEPTDSPFCYGHLEEILANKARGYGQIVHDRLKEVQEHKRPPQCESCIGQLTCNVGCYHSNWKCTGDLSTPPPLFCELKRESAKVVSVITAA